MAPPESSIDILCVVAHSDDEIFCAGVLAHHARAGRSVVIAVVTDGAGGPPAYDTHMAKQEIVKLRRQEQREAAKTLGTQQVEFLDFEDGGYITEGVCSEIDAPPEVIAQKIRGLLETYRPKIVLTHGPDGEYGHPHHITVSQCTTMAVEQMDADYDGQLYYCCAYDPEIVMPHSNLSVRANYIFPVTGRNYEARKKVMLCYVSQLQVFIGLWGRDMAHECYHRVGSPNEHSQWFEVMVD